MNKPEEMRGTRGKYYARLKHDETNQLRLFEIVGYRDGMFLVLIDFIFPIRLTRIVFKTNKGE
jgi:hypothetical protein